MKDEKYVTIAEAARILHVNRKHIYRLLERNQLRRVETELYHKHGPVLLERAQVEALLPRQG